MSLIVSPRILFFNHSIRTESFLSTYNIGGGGALILKRQIFSGIAKENNRDFFARSKAIKKN